MAIKKKIPHILGTAAVLTVFLTAILVLRRELSSIDVVWAVRNLSDFPLTRILAALVLTAVTYLSLCAYDFLALRYIKRPLTRLKTFSTSFVAIVMSGNLGLSFLAGNSMRYRLYSGWGLGVSDIAKVVAFCAFSSTLGFLALGGLGLLIEPSLLSSVAPLSMNILRPLGVLLLSLPIAYLILCAARKRPLKIFRWEMSLPSIEISAAQFAFSALNWGMAAAVLYILLPSIPGLTFLKFVGIFIISQEAGLLSQIPGGLGVFDSAIIFFLAPFLPASAVLEALLLYRGIYYLLPLCAGLTILGGNEILRREQQIRWITRTAAARCSSACGFAATRLQAGRLLPVLQDVNPAHALAESKQPSRRHIYDISLMTCGGLLLVLGIISTLGFPGMPEGTLPSLLRILELMLEAGGIGSAVFIMILSACAYF